MRAPRPPVKPFVVHHFHRGCSILAFFARACPELVERVGGDAASAMWYVMRDGWPGFPSSSSGSGTVGPGRPVLSALEFPTGEGGCQRGSRRGGLSIRNAIRVHQRVDGQFEEAGKEGCSCRVRPVAAVTVITQGQVLVPRAWRIAEPPDCFREKAFKRRRFSDRKCQVQHLVRN
jgi:hypothetical protein